uniref:Attacin C-terminal domain-containing protein n=1 Tax=Cuerna arida TaxID=1464854 RepID=A0A1B6FHW5_9HEMI
MQLSIVVFSVVAVVVVVGQDNRDWHVGADSVRPSGTVVHGHANIPLHRGSNGGQVDANVHGSRVFGGPYNRQQTVGGGVQYQHPSGVRGGLDVTHSRGQGNTYGASVSIPF